MPNVFEMSELPLSPFANLIICGDAQTGPSPLHFSQADLPAFQALLPDAPPSAGLPCFRLTLPTGFTSGHPDALTAPLPDADRQTLDEILSGIDWVTLILGNTQESLALALTIARYAREIGLLVTAFQSVTGPLPWAMRQALLEHVDFFCQTPAGLDVLDAAQALWSSINAPSVVCVDYADLAHVRGMGAGHLLWMPLSSSGAERMRDMVTSLPPFQAEQWLWAVLVLPDLSLDEFTVAGDHVSAYCSDQATVCFSCPTVRGLPDGLYLFLV